MSIKTKKGEFFAWLQGREPTMENCSLWMQERAFADMEDQVPEMLRHKGVGPEDPNYELNRARLIAELRGAWLQVMTKGFVAEARVASGVRAQRIRGGKKTAALDSERNVDRKERDDNIRADADKLRKRGVPGHEVAGRIHKTGKFAPLTQDRISRIIKGKAGNR